jgi:hypothetical protein
LYWFRPCCFPLALTLSYHPISLLPAGTEDRDQEIAPSAEDQNWDFRHETAARSIPAVCRLSRCP